MNMGKDKFETLISGGTFDLKIGELGGGGGGGG